MAFTGGHNGGDSTIPTRRPGPYPFQKTGDRTTYEMKVVNEGLFARIDMPGVDEDEIIAFVEDNTLYFKGVALKESQMQYNKSNKNNNQQESNPRTYLGSFVLHSDSNDIEIGDVRTEMKHGVCRMLVPALRKDDPFASPGSPFGAFPSFTPNSSEGLYMKNNPFQCDGPKPPFVKYVKFESIEEKLFVRVDMPGVDTETVQIGTDHEKTIFFYGGEAKNEWKQYDESGRNYLGNFSLGCDCCRVKGVKGNVINGVLRMVVTKAKKKIK